MTDPFSIARPGFIKQEELENRHLLIFPTDKGTRKSNIKGAPEGSTYEYIVCDVVVLDGPTTDLIDEVPCVLEDFQLAGEVLVGQLRGALKRSSATLGKLVTTPSQYRTRKWELSDPDEAIKPIARIEYDKYRNRAPAAAEDPFATV